MKSLLALLLVGSFALGAEVKFSGETKKVGGVEVAPKATFKVTAEDKEGLALELSGAGIRKKLKGGILTFNVYVTASYVADLKALRDNVKTPLNGLKDQKAKVLQLTMLRGLSANDIRTSFEEALALNKVDIKAEEIKNIFAQWKDAVKTGDTITIIGYPGKDLDQVEIHVGGKVIKSEGKQLSQDFFSIWFGAGDDYMLALQKELVGKD